ncbi:MAG: hypothetical protein LBV04_01630 [Deferribacteraceae bacterium]|jgi:hypothetical protein|nr:hypothetical protein [Deferribacteraceae bacterium]
MNYCLIFCGYRNEIFDTVVRLMLESARESDYLLSTKTQELRAPYSSLALSAKLVGSARPEVLTVILDFDHVYVEQPVIDSKPTVILSPKKLGIEMKDDSLHYWGVAGAILKIISDLSPAYVTSYLIDKDMNDEMNLFKKHSVTSLPLDMQEYIANFGL